MTSRSAHPGVPAVAVRTRPEKVRIVIADEQPIFRDGLRRLLETVPGLVIVGEAVAARQAAQLVRNYGPDILLLGLPPSGPFQLDELEDVLADGLPVRTILLSGSRSAETFEVMGAAMQLNAHGVVPKDSPPTVLFDCIDTVMAGRYCVGGESVANVATSVRRLEAKRRRLSAFGLTRRELEILRAVVSGQANKAIAHRFSISENTVKRHLTHIFNKGGASNRVELAIFAAHHQLIGRG